MPFGKEVVRILYGSPERNSALSRMLKHPKFLGLPANNVVMR